MDANVKELLEMLESELEMYRHCYKDKGTAILCICDACKKEWDKILGVKDEQ